MMGTPGSDMFGGPGGGKIKGTGSCGPGGPENRQETGGGWGG